MLFLLKKIEGKLKKMSKWHYFFIFYLILLLFFIIPLFVLEKAMNLNPTDLTPISEINNQIILYILTVVVSPILESFIFQFAIIKGSYILLSILFDDKIKEKLIWVISICLSALIFGFSHNYNVLYMTIMTVLGLYWGIVFYLCEMRNFNSLLMIILLHSLYNLTVLSLDNL